MSTTALKRTAKTDYAMLVMLRLAGRSLPQDWVPLKEICLGQNFPQGFIVQILQQLRQSGLVQAARGAAGGYRLARSAQSISIADIHFAVEGEKPRVRNTGACADAERALAEVWEKAVDAAVQVLQTTSLADLAQATESRLAEMYHI